MATCKGHSHPNMRESGPAIADGALRTVKMAGVALSGREHLSPSCRRRVIGDARHAPRRP